MQTSCLKLQTTKPPPLTRVPVLSICPCLPIASQSGNGEGCVVPIVSLIKLNDKAQVVCYGRKTEITTRTKAVGRKENICVLRLSSKDLMASQSTKQEALHSLLKKKVGTGGILAPLPNTLDLFFIMPHHRNKIDPVFIQRQNTSLDKDQTSAIAKHRNTIGKHWEAPLAPHLPSQYLC